MFGPQHAAVNDVYEQFRDDCVTAIYTYILYIYTYTFYFSFFHCF